jgi:hypothetical protein
LHKGLVKEYKIFCRVEAGLKDIILKAVDNDYVLEIKDKFLGFLHQTPKQIITHLHNREGQLDFADTKKLIREQDSGWDGSKVPQVYFNGVEKAMKQIKRAGITSDLNKRRDMALYFLKTTGEYEPSVREWESKPAADKTWANIKVFISNEFTKENKQTKITAKQFKANLMHEQAEITKELINNLTQAHTKRMEALIKLTTDAMKKMLAIIKTNTGNQNQKNGNQWNTSEEKKKIHEERKQKFKDAPVCKNCGKKHP